jgi:Protein of unknown function (DUF3551)
MRLLYALIALAAASTAQPASAQTYGAGYPVCLHVYGPVTYYDCAYTSIAQCNASASGRAAQCVLDPYSAQASVPSAYALRRVRRAY